MSGLATHTRDGMPSVAAMMEVAPVDTIEVDTAELVAWAKDNKLSISRSESIIGQVNAARASLGLPQMKVRRKIETAPVEPPAPSTTPLSVAALPCKPKPVVSQKSAPTIDNCIAASEAELLNLVTEHSGTVTGLVTPEIAGFLLALNTGNRPMANASVDRFVAILRRGAWLNTGEPVIVSAEGILSDGQHRLRAVQVSGIAAEMDVRFGIARAAFVVTNTGARRTAGNALSIAGKPHASMQAAIGRMLVQYDAGAIHYSAAQIDPDMVMAASDNEPAIGRVAALIHGLKMKPLRTAPVGLALVLATRASSFEQAETFARLADDGRAGDNDGSRRLNIRLRDIGLNKERLRQLDVAVLTVRAWNAWIAGRPIQVLKVTDADRAVDGFPKVEPAGRVARPFTPEEDATLERMRVDGASLADIAAAMAKAKSSIKNRLDTLARKAEGDG